MRILVFAPHPDDEVLGCGGTIAKYAYSGSGVFLCVVTKAYKPDWSDEQISNQRSTVLKASKVLGVTNTFFLDFPTVKLDTVPQKELNDAIIGCIKDVSPELVIVPHNGDVNLDHRIVFNSVMVAARPMPETSVKKILSCEILSETDWAIPSRVFVPDVYVEITNTLKRKLDAMKIYDTELKKFPHSRSLEGIVALAQKRGVEAGVEAAESFKLIREIMA